MKAFVCPFCGKSHLQWEKKVHHDKHTYEITKITYKIWCEECGKNIEPTEDMKHYINTFRDYNQTY